MKGVKRVLYVNGGTMDFGGISAYMMNYYRNLNRDNIQIDFIVHGKEKGRFDDEITALGGKIYYLPLKRDDFKGWKREIIKIFKSGEYRIVHSHADTMNGYILKIAKKCKIPVRISHSHNTAHLTDNKLKILIHNLIKQQIKIYATHLWACSKAAGTWLYNNKSFDVIPNAVELSEFAYDREKSQKLKEQFKISDKFIIGNVGRFEYQKNHEFLIMVFNEVLKINKNAVLVLVGGGSEFENIKNLSKKLGIYDKILFLGKRNDVKDLMNMFDVFVMTSRFEGLPVTLVEAQANGLDSILSDKITNESDIINRSVFLSLDKPYKNWAEEILKHKREMSQAAVEDKFKEKHYSIKDEALSLENIYLKLGE